MSTAHHSLSSVTAIMPAWNEEGSVGGVVRELRRRGIASVMVADNASTDRTAAVARAAGAQVVPVPQRGYGSACLGALARLPDSCQVVLFCDADGADQLAQVHRLLAPVLLGRLHLHVGSRALGDRCPGALSLPQTVGNLVCALLMRVCYRRRVTDLGPFRAIDRRSLERLGMSDPNFGWTAEMQVKAFRLGLRYHELPVAALPRTAGTSKIGGRLLVGMQAGWIILRTILHHRQSPLESPRP